MFRVLSVAMLALSVVGCSLINPGPDNGQQPDWDTMGPKIQARVKYVAMFAFSMDQVKPYKAQVCETADQIVDLLDMYNDREASFEAIRAAVMQLVAQIEDENVRNAVLIFVDIILTESFNYAWEHYSDWIEKDEAQTAIIIARAVGSGIKEACEIAMGSFTPFTMTRLGVTTMAAPSSEAYIYNGFTVPGKQK